MKVHIVCVDDEHIIPRMMSWLVDSFDWSISDKPDRRADINYYAPYTAIVQGDPPAGSKSAAWFTHDESWCNSAKGKLWEMAARIVDLRLITAMGNMTLAEDYGLTGKLIPGVDRAHFTIDQNRRKTATVGVSGFGQPRKWPAAVTRLKDLGYDIIASGKGWHGIPSTFVPYDALPSFYHQLDVLLCTSLTEGIPAPPLEALACGVKVVIPSGVGVMDELPEQPGVRHYKAGSFEHLQTALAHAIYEDSPSAFHLREVSQPFSRAAWEASHVAQFKALLR